MQTVSKFRMVKFSGFFNCAEACEMNEGDVPVDAMHSTHVAGVLRVRCDGCRVDLVRACAREVCRLVVPQRWSTSRLIMSPIIWITWTMMMIATTAHSMTSGMNWL